MQALEARIGNIIRYNGDATALVMGVWSDGADTIPLGTTLVLDGDTIAPQIWRTGRPARFDSLDGMTGNLAATLRARGIRAAVGAPVIFAGTLWGAVVISSEDAPFPPEAEFRVADFADLAAQAIANAHAREELAASRVRIVEAGDAERRRLERNLHDGAQQRLVALSLQLRLLEGRVGDDPSAQELVSSASTQLAQSLAELRELARGIHPAVLNHGLEAALDSLAARSTVPTTVTYEGDGPLPEPVELAAYFVASEALANVAKYAHATSARVRFSHAGRRAVIEIADDGVGGADDSGGSGLRGLADRVEALDGHLRVVSPPGAGTVVIAELPCGS